MRGSPTLLMWWVVPSAPTSHPPRDPLNISTLIILKLVQFLQKFPMNCCKNNEKWKLKMFDKDVEGECYMSSWPAGPESRHHEWSRSHCSLCLAASLWWIRCQRASFRGVAPLLVFFLFQSTLRVFASTRRHSVCPPQEAHLQSLTEKLLQVSTN